MIELASSTIGFRAITPKHNLVKLRHVRSTALCMLTRKDAIASKDRVRLR